MSDDLLFGLSALAALMPAALSGLRKRQARDVVFWAVLAVAVAGPLAWVVAQTAGGWHTGLSITLWVTVAASLALFAVLAVLHPHAWRLLTLLAPYMALMGAMAVVWAHAPEARPLEAWTPTGWVAVHIAVSVVTYALVTNAALAALGAFLQERALKAKRPTALTRALPSVADCEGILVRLLVLSEVVLALGLTTGMATLYRGTGALFSFDHKTLLSVTAFAVIGVLLAAHFHSGVRGRRAARTVLVAYLLLTLGYPGVKFVTDVLVG